MAKIPAGVKNFIRWSAGLVKGHQAVFALLNSAAKSELCPDRTAEGLFFTARRYVRILCLGLCQVRMLIRQSSANNIGPSEMRQLPLIAAPVAGSVILSSACSEVPFCGQTVTKLPPGPNLHKGTISIFLSSFIFLSM